MQKYHYSPTPCHRQSTDTVIRSTRRVIDRSSAFIAESWRSHPAACPFEQEREFPRHPDYSVVKEQQEKRSSQYVEHEKHPKYNLGGNFLKKFFGLLPAKDFRNLLQPLLNRLLREFHLFGNFLLGFFFEHIEIKNRKVFR